MAEYPHVNGSGPITLAIFGLIVIVLVLVGGAILLWTRGAEAPAGVLLGTTGTPILALTRVIDRYNATYAAAQRGASTPPG